MSCVEQDCRPLKIGMLLLLAGAIGCDSSNPIQRSVMAASLNAPPGIDANSKTLSSKETLRNEPIEPLQLPNFLFADKVALGKLLFNDTRLSKNDSISCASCHNVSQGGDDGMPTSIGIDDQVGELNAPTVLNSSLSIAQFWDGRAKDLREQVAGPIHNPMEMGSNWEEVIRKLSRDKKFVLHFRTVYPKGLSQESISDAIAAYESALITVDSPFDKYLRGDALSSRAIAGYQLFKTIGCISCHQGRAVGGNLYQEFGVMRDFEQRFDGLAATSQGRIATTRRRVDLHRFKVPSLRNVELTAPYFHDGKTDTLEQAITTMAEFQLGESLNEEEIEQIRSFLCSLTGEVPESLK